MLSFLVIVVAGFAAGALNAVAGGGTFLTFPALVWFGVPPVMANATATLVALPGYLASAWAYRREIETKGSLDIRVILVVAVAGGLAGAGLLLVTSDAAFSALVPWLLLSATILFAAGPRITARLTAGGGPGLATPAAIAAVLAVSIYGGYFNGGLGIMLLSVLGLIGFSNLHGMNGLKNILSALLSVVSATTYAVAGLIAWESALLMALATTAGGYAGAGLARRVKRTEYLRAGITAVGVVMTVIFFLR